MSVWCSVVASIAFIYMISPQYEFSTWFRCVLSFLYVFLFIGGTISDSIRNDKIKNLEREVEKLKEKP